MHKTNWDSVIDNIQAFMVWFVIILVAVCTLTLILFDVLAGTGIDFSLTRGNLAVAICISLATTGLLMAMMFLGYSLLGKKNGNAMMKTAGASIMVIAGGVFCLDIVFDALTADILSFGQVTNIATVANPGVHWMFRVLIGGISVVGETLALAIILGMPVLKGIINDALPPQYQSTQRSQTYRPPQNQNQYRYDAASPVFNSIPKKKPDLVPASSLQKPVYPRPATQTTFMSPEPTYHPIKNLNLEDDE